MTALANCERRVVGLGRRLATELSQIKYVPVQIDEPSWLAGFEQLIQKLSEVLVGNTLCQIPWPEGTEIVCEPTNPTTGAKPEFSVKTPERIWLFEVKCPAFFKHQKARRERPTQLPIRGFSLERFGEKKDSITLPRDNTLKDFLASAERKFSGFSNDATTAILVIVWDAHMYEAISALSYPEVGLLTNNSWHKESGERVPFAAVDGVIVINRLDELKACSQETMDCTSFDPFTVGAEQSLPNTWCPNVGVGELDAEIAKPFDAWHFEGTLVGADYALMDYVMWFNSPSGMLANSRSSERQKMKRLLRRSTSVTALTCGHMLA